MKVTRSFWLGLGSGLILSAMFVMFFSPQQRISNLRPDENIQTSLSPTEETKQADSSSPVQPSESVPESTPKESSQPEPQNMVQSDRDFIVPKGASAEGIADLLFAQEFIKDKEAFLIRVRQMGVERKFRVGTFKLTMGLTEEEIVNRLLK